MSARKPVKDAREEDVLTAFVDYLNNTNSIHYDLVERPDPPDGILKVGAAREWVELTEAHRNEDEAHEDYSVETPGEKPFEHPEHPILNPDDRSADAIFLRIVGKLKKNSYQRFCDAYGPGILICCERDALFDNNVAREVLERMRYFADDLDKLNAGKFKEIYLHSRPKNFLKLCSFT